MAQSKTLLREIGKRQRWLAELQGQLRRRAAGEVRGGKPPTVDSVRKKAGRWLRAQHLKKLFVVEIGQREDGLPELDCRFDTEAWDDLQRTILGKSIYFTDNADWTDAEIVSSYRALHHVEAAFRTMKDPYHISLRPQYCWTDQKVEVHVFCCVLALMLCSLLRRDLHRAGIDRSIPTILDDLGKIYEVGVVYPPAGPKRKPTVRLTISSMTDGQRELYDALKLDRHLPA